MQERFHGRLPLFLTGGLRSVSVDECPFAGSSSGGSGGGAAQTMAGIELGHLNENATLAIAQAMNAEIVAASLAQTALNAVQLRNLPADPANGKMSMCPQTLPMEKCPLARRPCQRKNVHFANESLGAGGLDF